MPQTEGAGTVFTGGPGCSIGLPIYGKFRPVTGSVPATPNLLFNSSGELTFNALAPAVMQQASVTLTAAQVNGMYAAPVEVIPAPGDGELIVVYFVVWNLDYGSAEFADGGTLGLFYGTSGQTYPASATTPAAFLTGNEANAVSLGLGACSNIASADAVDAAVSASNNTEAFTTGTGSTVTITVYYAILSGVN